MPDSGIACPNSAEERPFHRSFGRGAPVHEVE
jgi:hypothetical protein